MQVKASLPSRLPRNEPALDSLALKLLKIYWRYDLPEAFDLLFDLAGPVVARIVVDHLTGLLTACDPDEVVARVFFELAEGTRFAEGQEHHTFRGYVSQLLQDMAATRTGERDDETKPEGFTARPITSPGRAYQPRGSPLDQQPPLDLPSHVLYRLIEQSFASLPELTQQCFRMHLIDGKSIPDIAQQLGLSLAAVTSRMKEARCRAYEAAAQYYEQFAGEGPEELPPEEDELEGEDT
ncbi:MAG: sigma factor-like helix-turn-helix DNA-binding protein [Planctomycetota bacterium]